MIYKKLIFVCLLSLNVYTIQYLIEGAYANSFEIQKVNNNQSIESTEKIIKIKKGLDNKIYLLLDSDEGCIVSEKPLNKDIVIIYKEEEKFKYDVVNPLLKKDSSDCVSELAFVTDEPNYFYNIKKRSKDLVRGYGFELNKDQILYKNNKIRGVDLIGDGIPNIITECFSSEGAHFNIFGGQNNEEKLLHRYTYLDMNLQASCTENEKIYSKGLLDLRNKYREN
ncbi:hypothetical protein [Acinetobacter baumannii]|uniref:hypothetical protein n=2 Tax=Acinetobacter baumannii TaxID=470 RepID=UPI0002BAFA0B|nr:hypothetical protein [Acinetobacter baumannii]EHT1071936.1 hypothetical protein [Acinetobacter baumannii]EJB8488578.1 hypothetical protein [Acinetobacter baumannii]EKV7756666.1 hypothetical protein [Acinetobacter baumannii]EKW8717628.1 hypothetical protein [Acinetobacter baumannii]ELB7300608.1 hypothetical protein [Acinetobacter baumannii]